MLTSIPIWVSLYPYTVDLILILFLLSLFFLYSFFLSMFCDLSPCFRLVILGKISWQMNKIMLQKDDNKNTVPWRWRRTSNRLANPCPLPKKQQKQHQHNIRSSARPIGQRTALHERSCMEPLRPSDHGMLHWPEWCLEVANTRWGRRRNCTGTCDYSPKKTKKLNGVLYIRRFTWLSHHGHYFARFLLLLFLCTYQNKLLWNKSCWHLHKPGDKRARPYWSFVSVTVHVTNTSFCWFPDRK